MTLGPGVVESRKLALAEITDDAKEQCPDDGYYTCATLDSLVIINRFVL